MEFPQCSSEAFFWHKLPVVPTQRCGLQAGEAFGPRDEQLWKKLIAQET